MAAPFSAWPWENLSNYKYMLYGPFLAKLLHSRFLGDENTHKDGWCLHILIICFLRGLIYQLWNSYGNMLFLTRVRRINQQGVDFKQIDIESGWDNFILLHALLASMACYLFPSLENLPLWNPNGFLAALIFHVGVSEPLYYCIHKYFHGNYLFTHYHSLHHSSAVPQPFTAGNATFLEHLILSLIVGIPILGSFLMGFGSTSMIYGYVLIFDFLRCLGHCNVEVVPYQLFEALPYLRYLIYTPTYHNIHHTEKSTNFCLFMPLYDALGKTLNKKSWELHKKISSNSGKNGRVPDFVFLAHGVDLTSAIHAPFVFRFFASSPFKMKLFLVPFLPVTFLVMLVMWICSKTFPCSFYNLRGLLIHTWVVPRFGFQYFLAFAREGINKQIEQAILRADKLGVKVLSLAALNKELILADIVARYVIRWFMKTHVLKENYGSSSFMTIRPSLLRTARYLDNVPLLLDKIKSKAICLLTLYNDLYFIAGFLHEWNGLQRSIPLSPHNYQSLNEALNGGGTLFVDRHPNLKVRVVHGNTLTAAVILNEIPKDVKEVFLTGATSKLGRAIALYLCQRRVKVLVVCYMYIPLVLMGGGTLQMLTLSSERFQKIQKEAPLDCQNYLVEVTKYQAAQNCKTWIVGKWITSTQQRWAPAGAHFHQFVVPPILAFRKNCTYGDLAAMKLPDDVEGLGTCEYTMDRGVVHACHAGGLVHLLEGWTHHEVGAIDVDKIDLVWRAASKHGFKPVSSLSKQNQL